MHRACEKLNISQQGLSRQIRSLEQEMGTTLFVRSHRGMALTKEGELVRPWLFKTYENYKQALDRLRDYQTSHATTIKLAVCPGVRETIGLEFFYQFMTQHPNIKLDLDFTTDVHSEELLQSDAVDAAFLDWPEHPDDYKTYTVINSPIRLVMRKDHPLAKKENLSFEDIAGERCYFPDDSHYMTRHFIERRPKLYKSLDLQFSSNDTSYFTNLPATLGGVALSFDVLLHHIKDPLVARPVVEDIRAKIDYCIKKNKLVSSELKTFSEYIIKNIDVYE